MADDLQGCKRRKQVQDFTNIPKDTDLTYVYNKTELIIVTKKSFFNKKFLNSMDKTANPKPFKCH